MTRYPVFALLALALVGTCFSESRAPLAHSDEAPVIPVGLDAFRHWEKLPQHRIGARGYMRSTYDRNGRNKWADASHFLYQESETFNVTLDVMGNGVLYFKRTNHWHGSPWHYEVDGRSTIVKETATADPVNAKKRFRKTTFIPEDLFPAPLTWTWSTTKGADLMWVPIPFEERLRIAYSRTRYGTGYYIYHLYEPGIAHVSQPLSSWKKTPPDREVLELIGRAGTDIAPKGAGVRTMARDLSLQKAGWTTLAEIEGPANIRALKLTVPRDRALDFGRGRIRITWDGREHASVDAPVALFFGAGVLYNDNDREYLVRGFPLSIRYTEDKVHLDCYWPMPFFKKAKIELKVDEPVALESEIRTERLKGPANHYTYFHATYTDIPDPEFGVDNTFLDTTKVEGGGDWSGNFCGMSFIFSRNGELRTLEGDPRFFFDDSQTPQGFGTGTEEWGGGGDYWGGVKMTLPFAGHPVGKKGRDNPELDKINSAYRFLISDLLPFGKNAKINLEHGAENDHQEHYSAVVYWYGIDQPTVILTDTFSVADEEEAAAHDYHSPDAGDPYELDSRYEWGPDTYRPNQWMAEEEKEKNRNLFGKDIFPSQKDMVRTTRGVSTFRMKLDPGNHGAFLRRKFDFLYPNQKARVSLKTSSSGGWQEVGIWYTAGSNTCVYSNPPGELDGVRNEIITGNRRWREEEFLLPSKFTKGEKEVLIRIEHIPNSNQLTPDDSFPAESIWSEARYWLYSFVIPRLDL